MRLIPHETKIDFIGQSRICAIVSAVLFAGSVLLMGVRGFQLGIDFAGGPALQVSVADAAGPVDEGDLRTVVTALGPGYADAVIYRYDSVEKRMFMINIPLSKEESPDLELRITSALAEALGAPVLRERLESVGPRIGAELRWNGLWALMLSWVLILLYIWFRFDLRFAPGAVVALIHDVVITAGVFVAIGLEFNLQVLAALLVVIGYSLNDTIVIYDRVRENLELRGATHIADVVNQSINQTLSRTLLTSLTTLLVVVALVLLGGPVLRDFALALLLGIVIGTYSTIYVASALLIFLEQRGFHTAQQA
ncbi:MAG: protein translocase subunit SecF [Myxococcales bacterium]|nr:protein translocase subunit SecF [Myxococcales bacterium]